MRDRMTNASLRMGMGIALVFWAACAAAMEKHEFKATGEPPYILDEHAKKVPFYSGSHALLISVSRYKGINQEGWRPLRNTRRELDEIQTALQQHGFDGVRIDDPDGPELDQVYKGFAAKYGRVENSRLLFFFAGHGYTTKDGFGYIVPIDASDPRINPEGFLEKAKPIKELTILAEGLSARHALFVFDSCFSGSIFASRGPEQASAERKTAEARNFFFQTTAKKALRQFITAGNESQEVPDTPKFGRLFIQGLSGIASRSGDGYVTGKELGLWLEHTVPTYAEGKQSPHSDFMRDSDSAFGDMVFQVPRAGQGAPVTPVPVDTLALWLPAGGAVRGAEMVLGRGQHLTAVAYHVPLHGQLDACRAHDLQAQMLRADIPL